MFRLNSIIASVLSLGIICSGSVFASGDEDGSKPPKPPKSYETSKSHKSVKNFPEDEDDSKLPKSHSQVKNSQEDEQFDGAIVSFSQEDDDDDYFREKFINCYRENFDNALSYLEGIKLRKKFPRTIEELADIAFDEERTQDFLGYVYNKVDKLEKEINKEKYLVLRERKEEQYSALDEIAEMVEYAKDENVYRDLFGV